jgi:hypothetical protein
MPCRGCGKKQAAATANVVEEEGVWRFELRGPRGRLHLSGGIEEFEQELLDALHPDALPPGARIASYILTWQYVEPSD